MASDIIAIRVRYGEPVVERIFRGREAWTLEELLKAGATGVATVERPAPRWSHYVHMLRKAGVHIETEHEKHEGAFPGTHGRYRLAQEVEVIEREFAL